MCPFAHLQMKMFVSWTKAETRVTTPPGKMAKSLQAHSNTNPDPGTMSQFSGNVMLC